MRQDQVIFNGSVVEFGFQLQELIQDGWEINPDFPVQPLAFGLECALFRDATAEQLAKDGQPRPTRAEILQRARDAKAAKKAGDTA